MPLYVAFDEVNGGVKFRKQRINRRRRSYYSSERPALYLFADDARPVEILSARFVQGHFHCHMPVDIRDGAVEELDIFQSPPSNIESKNLEGKRNGLHAVHAPRRSY